MKLRTLLIGIVIVSLLVSTAIPMATAKKPENPGGGGKEEPPADPVIAVVTPTGRGWNSLVVMNADGSNRVAVLEGYSLDTPSWSPDGSSIAFSEYYDELWRIDVVIDEDGVPIGENKIFLLDRMQGHPEWSPGGPYTDHILITRYPDEGGYAHSLEVIPAEGGDPIEVYTDLEVTLWNPVWSPGGDRIAVAESKGGVYGLAILDFVEATGKFVKTESHVLPHWPNCMDWARIRTQDEIAYSIRYKVRNKYVHELWTVDSENGDPTLLFQGKNPTWSPDDKLCFEYNGLVVHDFGTGESEQISKWGYYPDWCRLPPVT
jgi:dipeptidyl aminopeptidase/acylaminoacyl peptidase